MIHPSAEAFASMATDMPCTFAGLVRRTRGLTLFRPADKILNAILFNIIIYFMSSKLRTCLGVLGV